MKIILQKETKGAGALFISLDSNARCLGRRVENEGLEHPSFSSFASVKPLLNNLNRR